MVEQKENSHSHVSRPSIRRSLTSGLVLNLLVNLLLYIGHLIIARRLPREDYAVFIIVVNFISLMALFADMGLTLLFVRRFAEAETLAQSGKKDERGELLGSMLALRILMSIIVTVMVMILAPMLGYSEGTRHLMLIMLITLFISSRLFVVRSVGEAFLRGHNKYHLVALFSAIDALVFASLLFFYSGKILDLESAVWIYSFCHVPGFLLLFGFIYRNAKSIGFRLGFNIKLLRSIIIEGIPLIFSTAFLTIHNNADALLLDKLSTRQEVSAFGAGMRVLTAIIFLPSVFSAIIGPLVTQAVIKQELVRIRSIIDRSLRILLIIGFVIALSLSAAPVTVMRLLFGTDKYIDAAPLVTIFSWTFVPIAFALFMTEIAIAEGKLWISTLFMGMIMVLSIICDFIFIPHYGAFGAGMAKCIAVTGGSVMLFFVSKNLEVLDQKRFALFFLRAICCVALSLAVLYACNIYQINEVIKGAAICIVFVTFSFISKAISLNEVKSFITGFFGKNVAR